MVTHTNFMSKKTGQICPVSQSFGSTKIAEWQVVVLFLGLALLTFYETGFLVKDKRHS